MKTGLLMRLVESSIGAVQVVGTLLLSPLLRPWYNRWGATAQETSRPLPGDELVAEPKLGYTRAITIDAPARAVWPWLVQLGQGRGGLYSYDDLENLVGCDIHSADQILPAYQHLQPGDLIRMGPKGYPCFAVAAVEPQRSLVLLGVDPVTEQLTPPSPAKYARASWQFCLDEPVPSTTRLLVRQRIAYTADLTLMWRLAEPVNFVMERKMMLGIKERAESTRRQQQAAAV